MGPLPARTGCDCHVCRPDPSYDEHDRATVDTVLEHGWQVVLVGGVACACCAADPDAARARADEPTGPDFAYTVGLGHRADHPELLVSGLEPGLMHRLLNGLAQRVLDGLRLRAGTVVEGVLGGVPVVIEQASSLALHETVLSSAWFHRDEPEALVVVWPTVSGLFPWQPGAPAVLDEAQPPHWREPLVHGGGVAADPEWLWPVPPDRLAFSCAHVVRERAAVHYVARQRDADQGEDWTVHCGAEHDPDEVQVTHLAHLVRSAPSLRAVAGLPLDHEADRPHVDAPWRTGPLGSLDD